MADREDLATKAEVRSDLNIDDTVDDREEAVAPALNAAHEAVERYCRRKFTKTVSTAREFTPQPPKPGRRRHPLPPPTALLCGDMAIVPTLVEVRETYSDTAWESLDATDWVARLPPPDKAELGHPYRVLDRIGDCWPVAAFPTVRVTTEWNWLVNPEGAKFSTRLCAVRYVSRFKRTIYATTSSPSGIDELLRTDPDIYGPLGELRLSRASRR